jgi:hypothetical protein
VEEGTRKQREGRDLKELMETRGQRRKRRLKELKIKLRCPGPLLGLSLSSSFNENYKLFIVTVLSFLMTEMLDVICSSFPFFLLRVSRS